MDAASGRRSPEQEDIQALLAQVVGTLFEPHREKPVLGVFDQV